MSAKGFTPPRKKRRGWRCHTAANHTAASHTAAATPASAAPAADLSPEAAAKAARSAEIREYTREYKRQIKRFDDLMRAMSCSCLDYDAFCAKIADIYPELEDCLSADMLRALGCDAELLASGEMFLSTRARRASEQRWCAVDIEATGNSPRDGQIIEIGAVMCEGGQIVGEFSSLVHAREVPEVIRELTGIDAQMLSNAPQLPEVLGKFRAFLGEAVFVAHGAAFDYNFIAKSCMDELGAPLLNRRLDTLALSRRCIEAPRHGLATLREVLGISSVAHRALADAHACAQVLQECLRRLGPRASTEDILRG